MRALVVDHSSSDHLELRDVPLPFPGLDEAVVKVVATSLNFGEVALSRKPDMRDGCVLGWDAAGVVVEAAVDGSGPAVGERVVTLGYDGAWAEYRAASTRWIGLVPDGADLGVVSTIPVAALTALHVLRLMGQTVGRRVMITGASGGVGRYAVQLAARSGAEVVAVTGSSAQADALRMLGATEVVDTPAKVQRPVYAVLDNVGGEQLVEGYDALEANGRLISVGNASKGDSVFPPESLRPLGGRHGRRIENFYLLADCCTDFSADLTWLAAEVVAGRLDPAVSWRGDWSRHAEATDALLGRRLHGKAVLDVDEGDQDWQMP
ncbi:zinc-binding dehydrogenase [Kribbella sp. NPDC055071]